MSKFHLVQDNWLQLNQPSRAGNSTAAAAAAAATATRSTLAGEPAPAGIPDDIFTAGPPATSRYRATNARHLSTTAPAPAAGGSIADNPPAASTTMATSPASPASATTVTGIERSTMPYEARNKLGLAGLALLIALAVFWFNPSAKERDKIRDRERDLAQIVDAADMAAMIIEADGDVRFLSRGAFHLLHIPDEAADKVIGHAFYWMLPDSLRSKHQEILEAYGEAGDNLIQSNTGVITRWDRTQVKVNIRVQTVAYNDTHKFLVIMHAAGSGPSVPK
jgi:PAS domain-containing protein